MLAGAHAGFANGIGTAASMREPSGIAVADDGRVVVADTLNGLVRVLDLPERLGPGRHRRPCLRPASTSRSLRVCRCYGRLTLRKGRTKWPGRWASRAAIPEVTAASAFTPAWTCAPTRVVPVRAVRDGVVSSVLPTGSIGTLNEFLIGRSDHVRPHPRGTRPSGPALAAWATVLADPDTGKPARVRVRRGTHVASGDVIGSVNRFRHVHLNVGPPGEEANALRVGLPGLVDTVPPVIAPAGITLTDLAGRPLTERVRTAACRQRARSDRGRGVRPDG